MYFYFNTQTFSKILFYFLDVTPYKAINLVNEFGEIPIVITEDLECIHTFFLFVKNVKMKAPKVRYYNKNILKLLLKTR